MKKIILLFIALSIIIGSCKKDDEPEPIINWTYLCQLDAVVTNTIIYGQTPEGLRGDIYFEGPVTGDLINGYMSGIDYYLARKDEPDKVNAHAIIVTDDSAFITVYITGFAYDDGTIQDDIVSFETGYEKYSWLNDAQLTGSGLNTSDSTFQINYYYAN